MPTKVIPFLPAPMPQSRCMRSATPSLEATRSRVNSGRRTARSDRPPGCAGRKTPGAPIPPDGKWSALASGSAGGRSPVESQRSPGGTARIGWIHVARIIGGLRAGRSNGQENCRDRDREEAGSQVPVQGCRFPGRPWVRRQADGDGHQLFHLPIPICARFAGLFCNSRSCSSCPTDSCLRPLRFSPRSRDLIQRALPYRNP